MTNESAIIINGTPLTGTQSQVIRMAIELFSTVLADGIDEKDTGIDRALTVPYLEALIAVQKLLDIRPQNRIQ